eukprot:CAMPEP_0185756836 /NCGR_PEP_ID=MMETSP1174-20130828/15233_1 /TAXON_ID=35687 /ORGANISM="Dictyocha speculum, Strain CCMP1381" /LENGTH=81 /DNA_ID=CAMNT_0028435965 /DNA_START=196 /DNA_END=438 /DNA_ORIENTATION=-
MLFSASKALHRSCASRRTDELSVNDDVNSWPAAVPPSSVISISEGHLGKGVIISKSPSPGASLWRQRSRLELQAVTCATAS